LRRKGLSKQAQRLEFLAFGDELAAQEAAQYA
jgi:hypothetical protein